ncbi:MAG: hypothetical protein IPL18_11910 [Sphingomonadales bacterium]|nr:hypothetical protein [Sphingomonadales bacterium]
MDSVGEFRKTDSLEHCPVRRQLGPEPVGAAGGQKPTTLQGLHHLEKRLWVLSAMVDTLWSLTDEAKTHVNRRADGVAKQSVWFGKNWSGRQDYSK